MDTGDKLNIKSDYSNIDKEINEVEKEISNHAIDQSLCSNSLNDTKQHNLDDNDLQENSGNSSIDSNIEIIKSDDLNDDKENINTINKEDHEIRFIGNRIHIEREDSYPHSFNSLNLDRSLDKSKTSIDDLSFSQKTLYKSFSLRSLITELVDDEILINKSEVSKDLDEFEKEKCFMIIKAIKQDDTDKRLDMLKELCITEKGLILSDLRRIVWPIVTNSHHLDTNHIPDRETIINHPMYNQVIQDVNRTIKRFPPSIEKEERLSKEKQLTDLIMRILIENSQFHYYQGYHDICITFLLLLGEEKAFHVVNKVSNTHLSQFMEETMTSTQLMLEIIPILIEKEDKELGHFLNKVEIGTIFSLSWILTWFSHILVNNRNVERLFDIFIACDYRLSVYFTVCILLHYRNTILSKEKDMAIVFQCLTNLLDKEDQFPFELLLRQGLELMNKYPPDSLKLEQKRRMSMQRKREEQLRNSYISLKKNESNKYLKMFQNNRMIIVTSFVVAIGAVSYTYYKSQT